MRSRVYSHVCIFLIYCELACELFVYLCEHLTVKNLVNSMSSQKLHSNPKMIHTVLLICRWLFLVTLIWSISIWKNSQTLIDFIGILTCLHLLLSSYTLQLIYDREIMDNLNNSRDNINEAIDRFNKQRRFDRRLLIRKMNKDKSI